MELSVVLAANTHTRRLTQNLTMQQLADKAGISIGYVNNIEKNNGTNPTLKTIAAIAAALDTQPHALLTPPTP